jgi:hypothetical protein
MVICLKILKPEELGLKFKYLKIAIFEADVQVVLLAC